MQRMVGPLRLAVSSAYEHRHPNRVLPYAITALAILLVAATVRLVDTEAGLIATGSPFLLVILIVALRWGMRVGLFASVLSVVAERMAVAPSLGSTNFDLGQVLVSFIIYIAVAFAVGLLAAFYRGERLKAEHSALMERNAAEYQRSMVGILAHDLKAPLTAARGYLELGRRQSRQGNSERAEATLSICLEQLERLNTMISNLVEASRIEQSALKLEPVVLAPLLDRAVTAANTDQLHDVELDLDGAAAVAVTADAGALGRVLDNLLSNAIKYSPAGGPVTVSVCRVASDGGSMIEVDVTDRGLGVPVEEQEKIFAPYYRGTNQRVAAGTGVGLYICRELARKMGGSLAMRSRPGGGSVFTLRLLPSVVPELPIRTVTVLPVEPQVSLVTQPDDSQR